MSQRRGAYPPEFRQQMVELVKAGRKPSELAREFGCHDTSIGAWVRQITMERDILAKATAWFANKDSGIDKTFTR